MKRISTAMGKAKKLPSGSWRVQVYAGEEDGRAKRLSFTAPTKAEAELKAAQWQSGKKRIQSGDRTIKEAIRGYIDAKKGVLSPSTVYGYEKLYRNAYGSIEKMHIQKLTMEDLQLYVSAYSATHSPKSVANAYGLLIAAIGLYAPDMSFKVTLPQKRKKRISSPSDEDVQELFRRASPLLQKSIALAAFGAFRRSEVVVLEYGDIKGRTVHISKDMVQGPDKVWYVKPHPKTSDSDRFVDLPQEIIDLLGSGEKNERVVKYSNPHCITSSFTRLRDKLGVSVRFHDLRHYFASIAVVLGIPPDYVAEMGGWKKNSSVLRETYQNRIDSEMKKYSNRMIEHFDGIVGKSLHTKLHTDSEDADG